MARNSMRRGRWAAAAGVASGAAALALAPAAGALGIGQGPPAQNGVPFQVKLTVANGTTSTFTTDVQVNLMRGDPTTSNGRTIYPYDVTGNGRGPTSAFDFGGTSQGFWEATSGVIGVDTQNFTFERFNAQFDELPPFNTNGQNQVPGQTGPAAFANSTQPIQFSTVQVDSEPPNAPKAPPARALRNNHYKCYAITGVRRMTRKSVRLVDQFGTSNPRTLPKPVEVCNPVGKIYKNKTTQIRDTRPHLVAYALTQTNQPSRTLSANNQFGNRQLTTTRNRLDHLLLPSTKVQLQGPRVRQVARRGGRLIDHFACYRAQGERPIANSSLVLFDQFERKTHRLGALNSICNPTQKTHRRNTTQIRNPDGHLVSYPVVSNKNSARRVVQVQNQFGRYRATTRNVTRLLVPSSKRHCATFVAQVSLPVFSTANQQQISTITRIELSPYAQGTGRNAACPR